MVFDRVRENLRKYKKMPLKDVMNLSLNETLSRTLMTVVTTLIALFALLFFGGPVVFGFAFATIFGILIGTYSSIWVASAIVLWLGVKRDWGPKSGEAGTQLRQGRGLRCGPPRSTTRGGCRSTPTARAASGWPARCTAGRWRWCRPGSSPGTGCPTSGRSWNGSASFDVLLVGTGAAVAAPAPGFSEMRARLEAAGAGVDVMTTPSAARTYNVLLAEGRRVAAALMPV